MKAQMTDRELLRSKADTLTESEIDEVLEYISIMESLRRQASSPDNIDEALIRLLSRVMTRTSKSTMRIHNETSASNN